MPHPLRILIQIIQNSTAAVVVQVAIAAVAIIGFASLAVDIGAALWTLRGMQAAADAAALAALRASWASPGGAYVQEGLAIARVSGFGDAPPTTTVAVGILLNDELRVDISHREPVQLGRIIYPYDLLLQVHAVARIRSNSGTCLLALDPSSNDALSMVGTSGATFSGCDVRVNSSAGHAVSLVGTTSLIADHLYVQGGYSAPAGAIGAMIETGVPPAVDPYAQLAVPAPGPSCPDVAISSSTTIGPGTFCSLRVSGTGTVLNLLPGIYIINGKNGGTLNVQAGATIQGTGVTFVLTGAGGNYATVNIVAQASVDLSAPNSGPTAGLAFFQDPSAPSPPPTTSRTNSFDGGASEQITGALYFPKQIVDFGGDSSSISACTQIVAWQVVLHGNPTVEANCEGTGVTRIGGEAELIE